MNTKIIFALIALIFLSACAGLGIKRDPVTGLQSENQWERSAFGSSTDRIIYSQCDPEPGADPNEWHHMLDTRGQNCKIIDARFVATTGVANQMFMPAAVAFTGHQIGQGISDSGDTIDNSSGSVSGAKSRSSAGAYAGSSSKSINKNYNMNIRKGY